MDKNKKKLLAQEYLHRKPEMGVISLRCIATGETFLGISKDTKADFNSNLFKLRAHSHPNKALQTLWNEHGPDGFELSTPKILKYEDPHADHTKELEKLRDECFAYDSKAGRIWR